MTRSRLVRVFAVIAETASISNILCCFLKKLFIVFSICDGILSRVYTSRLYSQATFVSVVYSYLSSDRDAFHIINP